MTDEQIYKTVSLIHEAMPGHQSELDNYTRGIAAALIRGLIYTEKERLIQRLEKEKAIITGNGRFAPSPSQAGEITAYNKCLQIIREETL